MLYLNPDGTVVSYVPSDGVGSSRSFFTTTQTLSLNVWYRIEDLWQASSRHEVYINGAMQAGTLTGTIQATINTSTSLTIGASYSGANHFNGLIDDFRIHDAPNPGRSSLNRRGIAYEMAPRRGSSSAVQFNRRRRFLIGAH
jgi:hypothetical protein